MIPLNCSTFCPQPRKTRQKEESGKWSSMSCRAPPTGFIQQSTAVCCYLDDDELQADCSGPRGRPLCITLRWMTVWERSRCFHIMRLVKKVDAGGGDCVFTHWGWIQSFTLFVFFKLETFFSRLVSFVNDWCKLYASFMNSKKVCV